MSIVPSITQRLAISLPADRNYTGQIGVRDADGQYTWGPFPIAARAADSIAADHGNPERLTILPGGDPPLGAYRIAGLQPTGPATGYRYDLYGRRPMILLNAMSGDAALADANGRHEIAIHGGLPGLGGRLRATSGHFRVSDAVLSELARLIAAGAICQCDCVQADLESPEPVDEGKHDQADTEALTAGHGPRWVVSRKPLRALRSLVAMGEYSEPGTGEPISEADGAAIGYQAEAVANEYKTAGVTYQMGGDASDGGSTSDCSHFVNDALNRAGFDIPYTTTHDMADSEHFVEVEASEARAGDVIVQGGHMGIYSGTNDSGGHPIGTQMGNHGVSEAPWGPGGWFPNGGDLRFYRPVN